MKVYVVTKDSDMFYVVDVFSTREKAVETILNDFDTYYWPELEKLGDGYVYEEMVEEIKDTGTWQDSWEISQCVYEIHEREVL